MINLDVKLHVDNKYYHFKCKGSMKLFTEKKKKAKSSNNNINKLLHLLRSVIQLTFILSWLLNVLRKMVLKYSQVVPGHI